MKYFFFFWGCLLASQLPVAGQVAPSPAQKRIKDDMLDAATAFINKLSPDQKNRLLIL